MPQIISSFAIKIHQPKESTLYLNVPIVEIEKIVRKKELTAENKKSRRKKCKKIDNGTIDISVYKARDNSTAKFVYDILKRYKVDHKEITNENIDDDE